MTPNQVTAARVAAAFLAVAIFAIFGRSAAADAIGVALIITAISLDALDGHIARTKNLATPLGAQFDILGDRIIENLFFTFFATSGLITLWVPVIFFARGSITDFLRSAAAKSGKHGFGKNSMLGSAWSRAIVASRASRVAYAALKCLCFCWLALEWTLLRSTPFIVSSAVVSRLDACTAVLTVCVVLFCVLRAIPVIWEGRRFISTHVPVPARPVGASR